MGLGGHSPQCNFGFGHKLVPFGAFGGYIGPSSILETLPGRIHANIWAGTSTCRHKQIRKKPQL